MQNTFGEVSQYGFFDAPRIKLYRLANLRGLLKPGYEHGVRSRVREILIIRDLQKEMMGQYFRAKAMLDIATVPFMQEGHARKIAEAYNALHKSLLLSLLTPEKAQDMLESNIDNSPEIQETMREFVRLKESGLESILAKAMEQ